MEKDGRKKNIFAPDILVVIRGQKTYNGARKQEEKTTMLKFGMPTLIEIPEPEQCAALCRELELSDDPIWEIAERHGFRDPKMLSHHFKEIYGCTPSEKRKFFREVTIDDSEDDLTEE